MERLRIAGSPEGSGMGNMISDRACAGSCHQHMRNRYIDVRAGKIDI